MPEPLPIVLVPGLNCSARLYAEQIPGTVAIRAGAGRRPYPRRQHGGDRRRHSGACPAALCARRDFRWADTSRSTMVRQAPARVSKLALLDTSARPETPEQSERRKPQIALAQGGRFDEVPALQFPIFVHRDRQDDEALRARVRTMAEETGAEAFLRQQKAIMTRPDVRPLLASITLSDPGAGRRRRRAHAATAVARR